MGALAPKQVQDETRDSRATPPEVYAALDVEFGFTLDPCPLDPAPVLGLFSGLARPWAGERVFCNPPYSDIPSWIARGREADVAVFLLPVRSDLNWWHDHAMHADEVRFIRRRLRFSTMSGGAPFASVVVVFLGEMARPTRYVSWTRPERMPPRAAKFTPEDR